MASFSDALIAARFLKLLVTPFKDSDAFKLGLIDAHGKQVRNAIGAKEQEAYSPLHRIVFRLKQVIERVPGEQQHWASLAAAWLLVRESVSEETAEAALLDCDDTFVAEVTHLFATYKTFGQFVNEEIGNTIANVEGLKDEPVVRKKKVKARLVRRVTLPVPVKKTL